MPRLVIVGAGLGGCFLADALAEIWDVTVVELGSRSTQLQSRIKDIGKAAITYPHVGSGLGGSTTVWHNGLIEIEDEIFAKKWPFSKTELSDYYDAAFNKLSGVSRHAVMDATQALRSKLIANGIPENLLHQGLYYPSRRINVWKKFKLKSRVKLIKGEVTDFTVDSSFKIRQLKLSCANGEFLIEGDIFVIAAGGLSTPLLLQKLNDVKNYSGSDLAGFNYEDHPTGFVAEVTLDAPIYKLWNFQVLGGKGTLRLPMVVSQDGLLVSFQLRPAVQFRPRNKVSSVLSDLRNQPYKIRNYFRILSHWDDFLDVLSFKFGIHLPTRHYTLLMVAEQPTEAVRSVWTDNERRLIFRNWKLDKSYTDVLQKAINQVINKLGGKLLNAHVFPCWNNDLQSSSHHSGTARMHVSPSQGVCNENGKVHGIDNLYVCDGSLIPASGYANTGLTIAALSLRMADHLVKKL
ncbi:hypothetical protein B9Z35_09185 [Limnohabitans sp. Jir61]|uniref:GMC oxidoreductase n=1 Tax=Limnohabitans sp. Jir61 TaxID=1826168 RepID=UPI000D36A2E4|nr:GMC oxidoreductase [Limnohabitans sp. Jir61]PUE31186.1 hypothetical protein B9Z35_09185 [Limnohabitans sp. Jir61]